MDNDERFRTSENFEAATRMHNVIMDAYDALQKVKIPEGYWSAVDYATALNEFQSVYLSLPRQVGKTTSLLYILERDPENTILFVHNAGMLRMVKDSLRPREDTTVASIASAESAFRGKTFRWKNILLDEPFHMGHHIDSLIRNITFSIPPENRHDIRVFGLGTK